MKSLVKTKNKIIIILCLTIICLGIGFAYLAIELQKANSNKPYFDVSFTNVELGTPVQGGKNIPLSTSSITNAKKTINFNMTLYAPRDEVSYKVTVKNTGTIPAEIINLIESPDYLNNTTLAKTISPVRLTHNDIVGKVLEPGEELTLSVSAIFDYKAESETKKISYQITLITASTQAK